ncbi:MAG: glutathione S-transferase family protein, partial [Rhizomicrobium sp.]
SYTAAAARRATYMETLPLARDALKAALALNAASAERHPCLAARDCTLGDLAVAAHLSALDYFGEVPWTDFPATAEWYMRMKSRPCFRTLLADRVPGQPPVSRYADLDA